MNKKVQKRILCLGLLALSFVYLLHCLFTNHFNPTSSLDLFSQNLIDTNSNFSESAIDTANNSIIGKPQNCFFNNGQLETFNGVFFIKLQNEPLMIQVTLDLIEISNQNVSTITAQVNIPNCFYTHEGCKDFIWADETPECVFHQNCQKPLGQSFKIEEEYYPNINSYARYPVFPDDQALLKWFEEDKAKLKFAVVELSSTIKLPLSRPLLIGKTAEQSLKIVMDPNYNSSSEEKLSIYIEDANLTYRRSYRRSYKYGGEYMTQGQDPSYDILLNAILKKINDMKNICTL